MTDKKHNGSLATIRAELIADIESASDEALLQELSEDGETAKSIAERTRLCAREAAAAVLRDSLAQAKAAKRNKARGLAHARPALEQLKCLVREVLATRPDAAVAFRDGKSLSDTDWQTLYDDMVELGLVSRDADEH